MGDALNELFLVECLFPKLLWGVNPLSKQTGVALNGFKVTRIQYLAIHSMVWDLFSKASLFNCV